MRQFQYNVRDVAQFRNDIVKLKQWIGTRPVSSVVFQVYSELLDLASFESVCAVINEEMPDCEILGCSTYGSIMNGDLCPAPIAVVCTITEYQSTKFCVVSHELNADNYGEVADLLISKISELTWVKAVSMMLTIRGMSMTGFCDKLSEVREGVKIFGGGAFNNDINDDRAFVYSKQSGFMDRGIVAVLIGGDDFYVESTFVTGWKPLGRVLEVTDSDGIYLKELNNKPAFEVYYRYLHIKNDESFFNNTLEFPFLYETNGIDILRAPIAGNPDGSITMTGDIGKNVRARIAYGDPWTILTSVRNKSEEFYEFAPEALFVFSCAARKTYWGLDEIGKETLPFQKLASTSGFYTSGEFLRTGKFVNQHNVTLVIAAMREGPKREMPPLEHSEEQFSGKISMINRLATFIKVTTEELVESTAQLELMAVTDGMTGLYNRGEIQKRIVDAMKKEDTSGIFLIMIDIDDFKKVNDTYGHDEGDNVIIALSDMLSDISGRFDLSVGRWGGEEFMILAEDKDHEFVYKTAEDIRTGFAAKGFELAPSQTVSIGITHAIAGEDADSICRRVDKALYGAKTTGKNKIIKF